MLYWRIFNFKIASHFKILICPWGNVLLNRLGKCKEKGIYFNPAQLRGRYICNTQISPPHLLSLVTSKRARQWDARPIDSAHSMSLSRPRLPSPLSLASGADLWNRPIELHPNETLTVLQGLHWKWLRPCTIIFSNLWETKCIQFNFSLNSIWLFVILCDACIVAI